MIKDERYGRYWGGMVFSTGPGGYILVLTVHFIHSSRDSGVDLFEEVCAETTTYCFHCLPLLLCPISVIAGFDPKVPLPANMPNVTGAVVGQPLKFHTPGMHQRVLEWMRALGSGIQARSGRTWAVTQHGRVG